MTAAKKKTTVKTAAKKATKTVKSAAPKDDTFKTVEDFTAAAREQFENFSGNFSETAEDVRETVEELTGAVRDGFDNTRAHVAEVTAELVENTRDEVTDAVQFTKDLTSAKSLGGAMEIQRNYWTNLFQTRVEMTRDIAERSVEVTRENMAPFTAKVPSFFGGAKA